MGILFSEANPAGKVLQNHRMNKGEQANVAIIRTYGKYWIFRLLCLYRTISVACALNYVSLLIGILSFEYFGKTQILIGTKSQFFG